ncbi:hypothetical protein TeGR_g2763 [Tetraparma gracilis]|uniref:SHOCT domain-containing protein n=1 Tax=Tetraparma gracilis TaxID=2962635 RepID=A0ABQ6MJT4_9STRA|nr:hypothetical protein TeGR_g2763 [Tetraparma gracilis]
MASPSVKPKVHEARFWEGRGETVIKTYQIDVEKKIKFETELRKRNNWMGMLAIITIPCILYENCCLIDDNIRDLVEAQHLAITQDGVRWVVDRHATQCRCGFQEQGLISKTVVFSKITDAALAEPAGKSGPLCCMVPNVLTSVNLDTASSGQTVVDPNSGRATTLHELAVSGLVNPHEFKDDVWKMVRGEGVNGVGVRTAAVAAAAPMERAPAESADERMAALTSMRDKGYITADEFEEKRKAVIADM